MKKLYTLLFIFLVFNTTLFSQVNNNEDSTYNCYDKSFIEVFKHLPSANNVIIDNICDSKNEVEIRVLYNNGIFNQYYSWRIFVLKLKNKKWSLDYYERVKKDTCFFINKIKIEQNNYLKIDSIYNKLLQYNLLGITEPFKYLDSIKEMRPGDLTNQMYNITIKKKNIMSSFGFSNAKEIHERHKENNTFIYCNNIAILFDDLYKYIKRVVMKDSNNYPIIIEK